MNKMKKNIENIKKFMLKKEFEIEELDNFEQRFEIYIVIDMKIMIELCEFMKKD